MDLGDRDSHNDRDSTMVYFFLTIIIALSFATAPITLIASNEVKEINEENSFWPADMVPHPITPGDGPTGPSQPEIA